MNSVVLMGRLTRDPEVRYSQGERPNCIARYTLAVDRRYRSQNTRKSILNREQRLLFVAAFKPEATQTAMVKKYTQPMSLSKIRNLQKAKHLRDRQQELLILHSQQVQLQAELIASSQLPQTQMEITRIRQQAHHSLRPETSRVHRGMAHP